MACQNECDREALKGKAMTRNRLEAPQENGINEVLTKFMLFLKIYFFHGCMSVVLKFYLYTLERSK